MILRSLVLSHYQHVADGQIRARS